MSELMMQIKQGGAKLNVPTELLNISKDRITFAEFWSQKWNIIISGIIGTFVGILPGVGGSTASFLDVYMIYVSLILSCIALFILGMVFLPLFIRIVRVRKSVLFPCVFILCIIVTYSARSKVFDCFAMMGFGVLGYILRCCSFQLAPFIIAFILAPEAELNFRLALRISGNGYMTFLQRQISAVLLALTVISVCFFIFGATYVAKAPKYGYTILYTTFALAAAPYLGKVGYKTEEFVGIAQCSDVAVQM